MDAALRSARHDARLLSNHLKRALGKGNDIVSESVARTATTLLLAQGDTRGDLDTKKALQLSRLAPPPPGPGTDRSTAPQDATGNAMDVEGDWKADAAVGSVGGDLLPSCPDGQLDATRATFSQEVVGLGVTETHSAAADRTLGGSSGDASANPVVDRRRLIAILAAEEWISAMASHLGSADPMTSLRSLLLTGHPSSAWFPRGGSGVSGGHQSQLSGMGSPSMELCESFATDEVLTNATAKTTHPNERAAEGLPHLGGDSHSNQGKGRPALRKQRRPRSAEDSLLSSSKSEPWENSAADKPATRTVQGEAGSLGFPEELNHGRKKRSRKGETADQSEEVAELGRAESCPDGVERSGLARSSSFTTSQRQEMTAPEAAVTGNASYFSLPKLKASRLSW